MNQADYDGSVVVTMQPVLSVRLNPAAAWSIAFGLQMGRSFLFL